MTSIALLNWHRPLQPDLLAFTAKLLGKWQSPAVGGAQIMHYILRVLGFMQTRNFNLTFPVLRRAVRQRYRTRADRHIV